MVERFGATIEWLPFDLHPEYPPEGVPRGPVSEQMQQTFAANGLVYNPPPIRPNSMRALRLAEHARAQDRFDPMHRRLMDAYWSEGANIGDPDEVRRLTAEVGLPEEDVEKTIADGDAYLQRVLQSTRQAQSIGINGIPAFLLDQRLLILGAQPIEVFGQAFAQLDAA